MNSASGKIRHILILDPIGFRGGSKIASENILELLDKQQPILVLSNDTESWNLPHCQRLPIYEPAFLFKKRHGLLYYLHQLFLLTNLLIRCCMTHRVNLLIGVSSPSVDAALAAAHYFLRIPYMQFVHGELPRSRIIHYVLAQADKVFYLQICYQQLLADNTNNSKTLPTHYQPFINGLSKTSWPSTSNRNKAVIFWAASLLKWKGLDILQLALQRFSDEQRPPSHICYLKPQASTLEQLQPDTSINGIKWYENPSHFDAIRASASIFVSTSENEPFGLSILEALAAGLCVVIPNDGAYWDRCLSDGKNCIKYKPGCASDLFEKLERLSSDNTLIKKIAIKGQKLTAHYSASQCYKEIINSIEVYSFTNRTPIENC